MDTRVQMRASDGGSIEGDEEVDHECPEPQGLRICLPTSIHWPHGY